jgi:ppGpp synthetase/RelA/SpoT-type nucleotidyltranferase
MPLRRHELQSAFATRQAQYARATEHLKSLLNGLLDDLSEKYGVRDGLLVLGEPKSFESFYRKATDKYSSQTVEDAFTHVRDLARARVVCPTLDDSYHIVDMLRHQEVVRVVESSIDDMIQCPSPTGYRAIHLEVLLETPFGSHTLTTPAELQIRTALQEAWGHFTHADFYKDDADVPILPQTLMRQLSDLLYYTDQQAATLINELARVRPRSGDAPPRRSRPRMTPPW